MWGSSRALQMLRKTVPLLAWPAADALPCLGGLILGVFVVGRRRLTPVQLRDLRVDVLGGKGERSEVRPASEAGQET
jgi:hypothetical protein